MKKLLRANMAYAIGGVANSAALFLLIPYLVNVLPSDEYGAWTLFEVGILLLSMFILSGMDVGLMREYWFLESEEKRRQLSGTVLATMLGWGTVVTASASFIFWFFERSLVSSGFWPVKFALSSLILLATTAFAEAVFALQLSILRIREEVNRFVALSLARMLLFLVAAIGGVQLGYALNGALAGRLIAALVGVIIAIPLTTRYLAFAYDRASLRRVIRYGLPLLPTNIATYLLFAADRYFLNLFSTLEVVGIYSLTYKVTATLDILVTRPFSLDWAPRRFKIATEPDPERKYANALLVYLFIAISMGLLILAAAPAIYEWFVPEIYKQGMGLIPILLLAYLAYGLSYPLNVGIMLKDRTQYLPYLSWLSALLYLLLNVCWIPPFGMAGAAWATLLSYTFWTGSITVISLKLYPIHYPIRSLLALILAALGGYGGLLLVEQLPIMMLLALSLKVLWIFLLMTGLGYFLWQASFNLKLKQKKKSPLIAKFISCHGTGTMILFLIFLTFLFLTIEYRIELGPLSVAIVEPIALLFSAAVLLPKLWAQKQGFLLILWQKIRQTPLLYLFLMITLLALLIRPWAINWTNGLSDIRDWLIPAITFVAFLNLDYRDWRKWVALFLFVLYLNASVGIYQSLTNSGRPFVSEMSIYKKNIDLIGETSRASFAAGFYSHPNQFGLYLFMGFMLALGFLTERKELHWAKYLLLIPIGLALYWSYSKASLLVTLVALALWLLHHYQASDKLFLRLFVGGAIVGFIAAVIIAPVLPQGMSGTFWWRVDLWQVALETMRQQPIILLFGNGKDIYAQEAIHPQPHSLYVFMLLQYGLIGLLLTCAIIGRICQLGWQTRSSGLMKEHPILAGLWIALFGFFLISLVETTWLALLNRLFFVIIVSLFLGVSQQLQSQKLSLESLP